MGPGVCGEAAPGDGRDALLTLSLSKPNVHRLVFGMVSTLTSVYPDYFMYAVLTVNLPLCQINILGEILYNQLVKSALSKIPKSSISETNSVSGHRQPRAPLHGTWQRTRCLLWV